MCFYYSDLQITELSIYTILADGEFISYEKTHHFYSASTWRSIAIRFRKKYLLFALTLYCRNSWAPLDWAPHAGSHSLLSAVTTTTIIVRASSTFYYYKPSPRILRQHRILENLRKNKDIVITKPGKGNGAVILDRKLYDNTIQEIISGTFEKIRKPQRRPTLESWSFTTLFFT